MSQRIRSEEGFQRERRLSLRVSVSIRSLNFQSPLWTSVQLVRSKRSFCKVRHQRNASPSFFFLLQIIWEENDDCIWKYLSICIGISAKEREESSRQFLQPIEREYQRVGLWFSPCRTAHRDANTVEMGRSLRREERAGIRRDNNNNDNSSQGTKLASSEG